MTNDSSSFQFCEQIGHERQRLLITGRLTQATHQKTNSKMGNSHSLVKKQRNNTPLAIAFINAGDEAISRSGPQECSSAGIFAASSRTVPLHDHKEYSKDWPDKSSMARVEEFYYLENAYDYQSDDLAEIIHGFAHLSAELTFHVSMLSVAIFGNDLISKKRVGIKREERLYSYFVAGLQERIIDLSNRGLLSLNSSLSRFRKLVSLDLNDNNLSSIPTEIGLLNNLQELTVSNNNLTCLPESVGRLVNLRELNVRGNRISNLPDTIGCLKDLKTLIVGQNELKSLPSTLGNCKKLSVMEADRNLIEYLPAELSLLKQLRRIQIYGNPLITADFVPSREKQLSENIGPCTLRELALRLIVRNDGEIFNYTPRSIQSDLRGADTCDFCEGPIIHTKYARIRFVCRQDQVIPFLYKLCSPHWNDEKGRIRAMFESFPETTPKEQVIISRRHGDSEYSRSTVRSRSASHNGMIRCSQLVYSHSACCQSSAGESAIIFLN